jgi:hypothetical protein
MKQRTILFLALGLNVASLSYSVWLHQHAQEMATEALRERELEFVTRYTPNFKEVCFYAGTGCSSTASI